MDNSKSRKNKQNNKESMIKEIKITDKLGDARILVNNNFKELNERLKRIEKKLKTKKSKK